MSDFLRDTSLLQIGTTGFYAGHKFQIVGRNKLSWDKGFWLEWYLQFTDGRNGWLAEAQGFYAVSFATSEAVPAIETLQPQHEIGIRGKVFVVDDIKKAAISEKTGDAPGALNSISVVVDLAGPDGDFASIDYGTKTMFIGQYQDFALFNFKNLKTSTAASTFKFSITCPDCGKPMPLSGGEQTERAVCASCAALVATHFGDGGAAKPEVVGHPKKIQGALDIPIGTKGTLRGFDWQVIGYLERHDGPYYWSEYLLQNPTQGYRWLFEMNGHWSFITPLKDKPRTNAGSSMFSAGTRTAEYRGEKFRLFNVGSAVVSKMAGEFYWQVTNGETVSMEDYINPPEMLSVERSKDEVTWSLGEYVEANEIRKAFSVKSMPVQTGVGANQPASAGSSNVIKYWAAFVGVLILIQLALAIGSEGRSVYSKQFMVASTDIVKTQASESFMLSGRAKNLELTFSAPVQNNWIEVQGELVNDQTGETFEFEQGVEFYSGSDSDGPWSEGSRASQVDLSAILGGTYHVNFEATGPALSAAPMPILMQVDRDIVTWSNFWWSLILISIFPLLTWSRSRSFEMKRWSNSDFSPYASGDD